MDVLSLGFNLSPIIIKSFLKHYLTRSSSQSVASGDDTDEIDYENQYNFSFDQAFKLSKAFIEIATNHTVEELQSLGSTFIPPPFWVHNVEAQIPITICNDAAQLLIKAFGGKDCMREAVGGTRWWQVRPTPNLPAEWICMKSDRKLATRHNRLRVNEQPKDPATPQFFQDIEGLPRTMLYVHGGAYYWGSINTHRYMIWRMARKMRGKAFAVSYRLSPQYGFPCALHDVLSAYLYLLYPPPGAHHKPVDPSNMVFAGDSAGGGLLLSLLLIIRDLNLPLPSGAILISPWCDLSHSMPSILKNTETDIIPPYGFIHKPSTLWPPPDEELLQRTRQHIKDSTLTSKSPLKDIGSRASYVPKKGNKNDDLETNSSSPMKVPKVNVDGKTIELNGQIQMYATNDQVGHPYVSPVLAHLGGLCPLFILASDAEVLRDEAIYVAHKAARPNEFKIKDDTKKRLPTMFGIEDRYGPTKVHFQLYDKTCHDLPLFSICEPAKYTYRAMAAFCFYVTKSSTIQPSPAIQPINEVNVGMSDLELDNSFNPSRSNSNNLNTNYNNNQIDETSEISANDADRPIRAGPGTAGHNAVYDEKTAFKDGNMIRERVTMTGVVRPMEDPSQIECLQLDVEEIGIFKPGPVKRYLEGVDKWKHKFKHTARNVEKEREKSLRESHKKAQQTIKEGDKIFDIPEVSWRWQWALENEKPPPASVVARRDTNEARKLAEIVDKIDSNKNSKIVNLWSLIVHLLSPQKSKYSKQVDVEQPWSRDLKKLKDRDLQQEVNEDSKLDVNLADQVPDKTKQWLDVHVKDD